MGTQQSTQTQIQKYWQQTLTSLPFIPGKPKLVQSIRRPTLYAQRYTNQMIDTNQQQQASIFRERKISHQNIVNVYDFQIRKGLLGCARNANFYDIVTQRVRHRLASFSNLSCEEMIYVFHQALCGYGQLHRYDKLCYPNANMIGIKQTGQIKVWINQNWSDNSYRVCRHESMSIDALWNCIKMCGDSRGLVKFNQMYYKLDAVNFSNVLEAIRSNFSKEIMEGRFQLQARMKMIALEEQNKARGIITQIVNSDNQNQNNYIRPRAVSQQLRRKQHNLSGTQNIQYKNINQIVYQDQLNTPYRRLYDDKQSENNLLATKTSLKNQVNIEKPQSSYPYRKLQQYQPISTPVSFQTQNLYLSSANHVYQRQPNLTLSQAYTKIQSPQTPTQISYKSPTPSQQVKKPQSIIPNRAVNPPVIQFLSKSLDNNNHVRFEHTPPSQKRYVKQNDSSQKNKILMQNYITNQGGYAGQNYNSIGPKIGQIILVPNQNKPNPSYSQTISFTTSQQNSKQNLHKNTQTPPSQSKLNYSTNPHPNPSPSSHPSQITYNLPNPNNYEYDKKKLVNFNYNQNNIGYSNTNNNLNNYQSFGVGNNYGYGYKNSEYVPQNLQRSVAIKLDNFQNANLNSNTHKTKLRDRREYHIQPYPQQNQNQQSQSSQMRNQQPQSLTTPRNNHINQIPQLQLNLQLIQNRKEGLPSKEDYSTQRPAIYQGQNINSSSNRNSNSNTNSQVTRYEFKSQRQTMQDKQKNNQSIRHMDITEIPFGSFGNQNIHNIPTSPPTATATQPYIFESPVKSNKKKNLQIYPQIHIHNYSTISEKHLSNQQESQLQNSSDSRKVAQQFKYYLRSIQKSPKKNQQNSMVNNLVIDANSNTNINNTNNNSKYNSPYQPPSQKKPRNLYDASIIPERWQEQQSFSQIL